MMVRTVSIRSLGLYRISLPFPVYRDPVKLRNVYVRTMQCMSYLLAHEVMHVLNDMALTTWKYK
jgi:hypothetical protein